MGADFAAAPNQFMDADGNKDGLNVDMCGEIASRLGLELEWTNLAFPGLVPGLQASRFDGLCTSIFINPKRKEIMQMVAYVQWGEGLMVRDDDSLAVECAPMIGDQASYEGCFDQLAGRTIAVAAAGTTNQHLIAESERMQGAGKDAVDIRAFDTNADAIQALVSGQADGRLPERHPGRLLHEPQCGLRDALRGRLSQHPRDRDPQGEPGARGSDPVGARADEGGRRLSGHRRQVGGRRGAGVRDQSVALSRTRLNRVSGTGPPVGGPVEP